MSFSTHNQLPSSNSNDQFGFHVLTPQARLQASSSPDSANDPSAYLQEISSLALNNNANDTDNDFDFPPQNSVSGYPGPSVQPIHPASPSLDNMPQHFRASSSTSPGSGPRGALSPPRDYGFGNDFWWMWVEFF